MNNKSPVPRLDLAPKLRRPLSLWNPLDYLLLLCWVFYFPQALRWYVDTFGGGYIPAKEMNWSKRIEILRNNSIQRQLLFQGVILTIITPILICLFLQALGLRINWFGVAVGVASGVALGVTSGVAFGVAFGVLSVFGGDVALGVALGVALPVAARVSVTGGVALDVVSEDMAGDVTLRVVLFLVLFQVALLAVIMALVKFFMAFFMAFLTAFLMTLLFVNWRPENWLLSLFNWNYLMNGSFLLPRITTLSLPNLDSRLKNWLLQDWENGIHNVNQLLAYTMQYTPVVEAVNKALEIKPEEEIIWSISQLSETTYDWKLIYFIFAHFVVEIEVKKTNIRLDTPSRAAAAGFWYLHEKQPTKATEAFEVVRSLLYGEEIYILAVTLAEFNEIKELDSIANLEIPTFPTRGLLRSATWQTLDRFVKVIEDVKIIKFSISRVSRSSASNRALGELTTILNTADTLPKAEQGLIIDIANNWQQQLLQITGEVGEISITKPISSHY
ncbi:MAG: ATP-binding protein, partial [Dolichospermum sp.]